MTKKDWKIILRALRTTTDIIQITACKRTLEFEDEYIRTIFYAINDMCIRVSEELDALEQAEKEAAE